MLGTANLDKIAEYIELLNLPVKWDTELARTVPPPMETGATLEDNALLKARYYYRLTGNIVLADDTGLEVDVLSGAPGVNSSRFAGDDASYQQNRNNLLKLIAHYPRPWLAKFMTVLAVVWDSGQWVGSGSLKGEIIPQPRGANGFGYDPIFQPEGSIRTLAELSLSEKNAISHRSIAVREFLNVFRSGLLPND